jgi:hypothetical protein
MERLDSAGMTIVAQQASHDWTRLIRKLRWIGLDDEAKLLETAVNTLPADERCSVSFAPFSTD